MPGKTVKRATTEQSIVKDMSLGKNVVLLGSSKSGKTHLLKQLSQNKDYLPVYIPLKLTSISPESFAVEYVSEVLRQALKTDFEKAKSGELKEPLEEISAELLKIKPDQKHLLELALGFPELVSRKADKRILMLLDDWNDLLEINTYSQIKNVFSFIDFSSRKVRYILSTSGKNEFDSSFSAIDVNSLTDKEADDLIKSYGDYDSSSIKKASHNNVFLIHCLCTDYEKSARQTITSSLSHDSLLSLHLSHSFDKMLNRARGRTLLRSVLNVLARHSKLKLSDIARKIYRSAPVTKSLLERLVAVDMLVKDTGSYSFSDEMMRMWHLERLDKDEFKKQLEEWL